MLVAFLVCRGVVLNAEDIGASEPCSRTGQQLPGDGILGDGGSGGNRVLLYELDEL
jgi:hypothetical protein